MFLQKFKENFNIILSCYTKKIYSWRIPELFRNWEFSACFAKVTFVIICTNKFAPFFIKNWSFIVKKQNIMFYSKLDIFTQKRIYYTYKNSLIFQAYIADTCPTLRQWRFTSVNFNQKLLVMPTFIKRRKLICTPDNILNFRKIAITIKLNYNKYASFIETNILKYIFF